MSEYIVAGAEPNNTVLKSITKNGYEHEKWLPVCEEIVRCRDCKHFCEDRRDTSIGWVSVFVCDSEQWSTSSLMPSHKIKPDGFCAWGERREP